MLDTVAADGPLQPQHPLLGEPGQLTQPQPAPKPAGTIRRLLGGSLDETTWSWRRVGMEAC